MSSVYDLFDDSARQLLQEAIAVAELNTSGEIRLHIDETCKEDPMDRAAFLFEELEMHKTALRNGVLIYFALKDRKFAILGDSGINNAVPAHFWESTRDAMLENFKNGKFIEGLQLGILSAGEQLKAFFPYESNDTNELSDEITFGH
ncbi:MAG: hypothetical protein RL226_794 [Bacteroidota bacterium]